MSAVKKAKRVRYGWRVWEAGDCVYEGVTVRVGKEKVLVGSRFVSGLDNCPGSLTWGDTRFDSDERLCDIVPETMLRRVATNIQAARRCEPIPEDRLRYDR